MRLYEARPDGGGHAAIVVIQEAFGVNEHIEDVTRRFATAGYHAVAPDLFHRAGGGTAPYGDFAKVLPLFEGLDGDDAFCLGGRISLLVALRRPIGAGVGFYGGGIVTGRFPQFPPLIDEVPSLAVPWLGLFGDQDASIPVDDVETLRSVLSGTAPATEIVRYPEAGHGFHCDVRPDYAEADAHDAWARTLAWFETHLDPTGR